MFTTVNTMFNIICLIHLVTTPHDLHVENPFDLPSFAPYVHLNPSADPHDLQASLNSMLGGSPKVGITKHFPYLNNPSLHHN